MRKFFLLLVLAALAALVASPSMDVEAQGAGNEPAAENSDVVAEEKPVVSNVRFFKELNNTSNATVGQAYRLAHILYSQRMDDKAASKARQSSDWYRDELIDAGVIDSRWTTDETRFLSHIGFAQLCIKAANIEGGVMWTLTSHQRYAHREMVDRGLFPKINPRQYMSGPQALSAYRACRGWVETAKRELDVYEVVEEPAEEVAEDMPAEDQPAEDMPEEGSGE